MTPRPVDAADLTCELINLEDRFVLMSDNTTLPITNTLDGEGDDTDVLDDIVVIVAGSDADGWYSIAFTGEPMGTQ